MLTSIIFDLDETLIDREATMHAFLEQQYDRFSEHLGCDAAGFCAQTLALQAGGYADKYDAYCSSLSILGERIDLAGQLMQDLEDHYGNDAIAFEGAADVLMLLRPRYRTGLITNGRSLGQRNKLRSAGLEGLFDAVSISEEVGVKKPDPGIFKHCLEQLAVDVTQVVYVGDNPLNDIEPAHRMGMKTVWFSNARFEPPDMASAVVEDLFNLPAVIARL
jgi:putative hydrolase of the HAD superfamily